MKPITFPVWTYINPEACLQAGRQIIWLRGGEPTTVPASLPVFSTAQLAKRLGPGTPFTMISLTAADFRETLQDCPEIEDVILDMGTENAVWYKASDLLGSS